MLSPDSTHLICGCPGAGKTTRLLDLVEGELQSGTRPERIGYVTFGRAAIGEAIDRANAKFGLTRKDLPYFSTLHSAAYHSLGLTREAVLGQEQLQELSDYTGVPISGHVPAASEGINDARLAIGDKMLRLIDLARVRGVTLREQYEVSHADVDWVQLAAFYTALDKFKRSGGLVDFTDMLLQYTAGGQPPAIDVLFVDEAQDLSLAQWEAVALMAKRASRVYVAGDDDQAIYTFAGADVERYLALEGQVEVLGKSYRCPRTVQRLAAGLLERLGRRRPKEWVAREQDGLVEWYQSVYDIDFSSGEWLVLARNRYLLTPIMRWLADDGLFYEVDGRRSVDEDTIQSILAWEALRRGEQVSAAVAAGLYSRMHAGRGYKRGSKAVLETTDPEARFYLADLHHHHGLLTDAIWHEALDRISWETRQYVIAALRRGESLSKPRISVSTIHAAKGREAQRVALVTDMAGTTYREWQSAPDDETRVFYVATTRAREELHIVEPQTKYAFNLEHA